MLTAQEPTHCITDMAPRAISDAALLQAYSRDGADDAFRQIVERYSRLVFGTCHRILGSVDKAEDAAQSTFVALALKAAQIDASRGLGGWLHRVARQVSLDVRKAAARRQAREQEAWRRTGVSTRAGEQPAGNVASELDEAIDRLPAKLRAAVIQHYFEETSLEEIAARQGCTVSAVSMRLTRARALLHKRLMRHGTLALHVLDGTALVEAAALATPPGLFTGAAVRTASAALKGAAAVEPVVAHAVGLAQHALRRLLLWQLRWSLAGGVAAVLVLAVVPIIRGQTVSAGAAPAPLVPGASLAAPGRKAAATPAAPAVPVPPARNVGDPALIAELKKPLPFERLPAFKTLLDATANPLDATRDASACTALHWAARGGNEEPALLLLLRGASPNAPDRAGRTPFFDAIQRGDKWMALLFVLAGADINHLANDGSSPLSLAVRKGDVQQSELLLWLGARAYFKEAPDAAQPGRLARAGGNPEVARLFDDYSALRRKTFAQQPRVVPGFIKDGLQDAARRGDFVRLNAFLGSGVYIDTRDDAGKTALHQAIGAAQPDVVFYLLLLGANPNAPDDRGKSPLMATMGWLGGGLDAMRRFLIIKGASPATVRQDGHTEISWAAVRTNEHGMQWLLWLGANGYEVNSRYGTATQIAFNEGSQRTLDLLRRNGINEAIKPNDDPVWNLNNAALRGDLALVKKLLALKVAPDAADEKGNSPLMNAIYGRNVSVAKYLIETGADINYRNAKDGTTPLISTLCWDFQELSVFREDLLKAGADPNACGNDKVTPAMRACGHVPGLTLRQLIDAGADLSCRDAEEHTVLTRALRAGDLETAEFLRQMGATE